MECIGARCARRSRRLLRQGVGGRHYKRGYGFHPLLAYLDRDDGTGEALAGMLRPGNAGANTAVDHIDVFETAIDQLAGVDPTRGLCGATGRTRTKTEPRHVAL